MKKNLNIEVMRIISMLLIVLGHICSSFIPLGTNGSDIFRIVTPKFIFFITFHVNIFLLISGYCGIRTLRNILKIWKLLFSYLVLIASLNVIVSLGTFDYSLILLPFSRCPWWFMQIYIFLAMIAPVLLEPYLKQCSIRDTLKLIGLLIIIDVYFGHICHLRTVNNGGYDLLHFITIYMIGAFLRKIDIKSICIGKFRFNFKCWMIVFLVLMMLKVINYIVINKIGYKDYYDEYNHPFNIFISVCFFCMIMNIKFTNMKLINISSSVIGVYLLQEHPLIKEKLIQLFDFLIKYCNEVLGIEILFTLFFVVSIFIVAIIIDKIRIFIFNNVERVITGCSLYGQKDKD
ncbi:acyltransferase family protein [Bacteroides caecigallinarum]|nr:acyltransferase family protein [Bacteroides caecigallinarum]